MGGEKHADHQRRQLAYGSPPRGRGKAVFSCCFQQTAGITPAWAGKRIASAGKPRGCRDHPRMGGEKWGKGPQWALPLGSPPHGRGKAAVQGWMRATEGITPAWAGKSFLCVDVDEIARDHPRMGGEKPYKWPLPCPAPGSPPHGRGKGKRMNQTVDALRITPAWAGKSSRKKRKVWH